MEYYRILGRKAYLIKLNVGFALLAFFLFLSNASAESQDSWQCFEMFNEFNIVLTEYDSHCYGSKQDDDTSRFYVEIMGRKGPREVKKTCPEARAYIRSVLRAALQRDCTWSQKYDIDSLKPR